MCVHRDTRKPNNWTIENRWKILLNISMWNSLDVQKMWINTSHLDVQSTATIATTATSEWQMLIFVVAFVVVVIITSKQQIYKMHSVAQTHTAHSICCHTRSHLQVANKEAKNVWQWQSWFWFDEMIISCARVQFWIFVALIYLLIEFGCRSLLFLLFCRLLCT